MTAAGRLPSAPRRPARPRQRAACLLAAAVLGAHAVLLSPWPRAPEPSKQAKPPRALQWRALAAAPAADETVAAVPAAARPPAQPLAEPGQASRNAPSASPTGPPPAPVRKPAASVAAPPAARPSTAAQPTSPRATTPQAAAPTHPQPAPGAEAQPDPGGPALPIYRTQLPPATTLQYVWRRGRAEGTATLDWRADADGYRLTLQGQAPGTAALGWSSRGRFDEAGIAPQRYVEHRRGREARAANFEREHGRVSFSGPAVEHALAPGTQDRLSWLLQLSGVLAADAALATEGRTVQLWVVGTRGDATVWTFTVQARAVLDDLPAGPLADTVHLVREPVGPYDTQVQVWLDPARQHLPVQVLWRVRATGEGMSLALQAPAP